MRDSFDDESSQESFKAPEDGSLSPKISEEASDNKFEEDNEITLEQIQITTSVPMSESVQVTYSTELSKSTSSSEALGARVEDFECRLESIQDLKGNMYAAMKALDDSPSKG
jgi:prophage DNA circulation protein